MSKNGSVGWGFAPGTFGELLYGALDDVPFLVTLPIPWGTRATFSGGGDQLTVWPAHRRKARMAAELLLDHWGQPPGGVLVVQSTLPIGKGMASSSADMVASLRAVAAYCNKRVTPAVMAELCARIEPTDGIMFPGVVALDPIRGHLLERLGPSPGVVIVGVLGHGRINTEDHHRRRLPYERHHQDRLRQALMLARQGLDERRVDLLGDAGRISAEVEWERGQDPSIESLMQIADSEKTGLLIAHSGTVRGLLVDGRTPRAVLRRLEQKLWALNAGPVYRIPVEDPRSDSLTGRDVWCAPEYPSGAEPKVPQ